MDKSNSIEAEYIHFLVTVQADHRNSQHIKNMSINLALMGTIEHCTQ